jgi:hypothetical protein
MSQLLRHSQASASPLDLPNIPLNDPTASSFTTMDQIASDRSGIIPGKRAMDRCSKGLTVCDVDIFKT